MLLYLILGLACFGWGRVLTRLLGVKGQAGPPVVMPIWLGWAATLFIFQLLHLFVPITAYVVVPVLGPGILLSSRQVINTFHNWPYRGSSLLKFSGALILMLVLAWWIASRSMLAPTNNDSGLYHFQTMLWINSFPIIPGLGNLHSRLAFNQSFFTYAAALNFFPFFNQGRSIANSFLFLLTFATLIAYLRPIFRQPSTFLQSHPFKFLPALFTLPILGYIAMTSDGLASPSPDLASTLVQLAMFVIFLGGMADWLGGERQLAGPARLLTVLAATSVTIKLSSLVFAGVILAFGLACTWQSSARPARAVASALLPAALIVAVWCLRSFILSGAPLYPSLVGYLPVEWAVPREVIVNEVNWIYSWARLPGAHWSAVLGNWNWLQPWFQHITMDVIGVVYPLILSVFFFLASLVVFVLKKGKSLHALEWSVLVPVILTLLFWFFTAPDARFANALFFLAAAGTMLVFLSSIHRHISRAAFAAVLCLVFILGNLHTILFAAHLRFILAQVSFSGYQAVKTVPLDTRVTNSGLAVFIPEDGGQCWDAPLPCTPYLYPALKLRQAGIVPSGFMIAKPAGSGQSPGASPPRAGDVIK